ncbi:MAG TPA: sulfatase [Chloroflexota bacterium]|nr:sulfatase [Chloroflexota bacterium]
MPLDPLMLLPGPNAAATRPPNVLLITLDTLRADFLGAYGRASIQTPALDAFAAQSARFASNIVQQPQTNASHAAMLTGMYPASNGVRVQMVDKIPVNLQTLATLFAGAGYGTAAVYSWLSFDNQFCGFKRGFQTYQNCAGAAPAGMDTATLEQLESTAKGRADKTTDAAIAQLQALGGQPFFLWLHYFDAHYPYQAPSSLADQYDPNYQGPIDSSMRVVDALGDGQLRPAPADVQRLQSLYKGEITFLDTHLGRLFTALDQQGLADGTVVAIVGDHGEAFGEHSQLIANGADFFHPHGLYDTEVRTPLLMRWPGQIHPQVVQTPNQAIDLFPTLLTLAGIKPPDQTQGTSLLPLLAGTPDPNRAAFSTMPDERFVSVTVPGWKLIEDRSSGSIVTFDLGADPGETRDVSGAHPNLVTNLTGRLVAWEKRAGF